MKVGWPGKRVLGPICHCRLNTRDFRVDVLSLCRILPGRSNASLAEGRTYARGVDTVVLERTREERAYAVAYEKSAILPRLLTKAHERFEELVFSRNESDSSQ
jgi:hypothetical protein